MAYNTTGVTPGSGKSVSFDDNVQRVKVAFGPEGTQSDVSPDNRLPITSSAHDDDIGKIVSGNVREKWKVGFSSLESANFDLSKDATDLAFADGNVAGSSWADLCKSATAGGTETVYLGKKAFKVPYALELGIGLSQRFNGQEFYAEMVGVTADTDGNVSGVISTNAAVSDIDISASITVAANVWSITCATSTKHLRPGDWICIYGCADSRLNVGPLMVTANSSAQTNLITITSTLADGPYTGYTGGKIRFICPCGSADYHNGLRFYGASNSNADTVSRNGVTDPSGGNGNRARVVNWNPGNTQMDSAVPSEGGINYSGVQYTRSFRSKGVWRTEHTTGFLQWITKDQDSTTNVRSTSYRESEVPAQDQWYALRFRALNLPNLSVPVGSSLAITAISKAGTTTWTVTCPGHGLTVNDRVRIYGVIDAASFPNLTTDTAVASVVDANQFTIVSTTGTASSYGGVVIRVNGGAVPTLTTIVVQTYNRSYDSLRLVLIGSGTWADVVGNIVTVCGLVVSGGTVQTALHGRYRVARMTGTTLELEPMDGQEAAIAAAPASATAAGGTIIRNTSFRAHYARVLDYVRMLTEPANASNNTARSSPVYITGANTPAFSIGAISGTAPASGVANGSTNAVLPVSIATAVSSTDQSATAFAGSGRVNGTVVAAARGGGCVISAEINISALTLGTASAVVPILQESRGGTNFTDIWTGDPMTATGIQQVPAIPVAGRRRWCMHSVGGTSTTVTVTITAQELPSGYVKQAYYRDSYAATNPLATVINNVTQTASTFGAATALTATTQATPWCVIEGCKQVTAMLVLAGGPTVTTQPVVALELSNDLSNGFVPAGATMTAAGNGAYSCSVSGQSWKYGRLRVTTAAVYSAGAYTISTASIYGVN